jgi:1,4-alpha-glucan branching enzyme
VFNFNPTRSFSDYGIGIGAGKFRIVLDSDDPDYGGHGLVDTGLMYYTVADMQKRQWLKVYIPARTALVFRRIPIRSVHG